MARHLVPPQLALETLPTFSWMVKAAIPSLLPFFPKRKVPSPDQQFRFTAKPASERLIDQYAIWSGAPAWRYEENIPPHFCSHWAMGALATLGGFAPYDVRRILNQGLHLKINAPISRHDTITMLGCLKSITQDDSRIRIHTQVAASTSQHKDALIIDSFTAIQQKTKTEPPRYF